MDPIAAEKELAALLQTGQEQEACSWLAGHASALELTGRCYSLAITGGMEQAALACARAGFHLAVLDDPAGQRAVQGATGMRGLMDYLNRYRYCKAQRTYYLPIVQSELSCGPIRALLEAGVGLSATDTSELLSLSVRSDNVALAQVLAQGGAELTSDIRESVPGELKEKLGLSSRASELRWAELATPQRTAQMLELILANTGAVICPIRAAWFSSYSRNPEFPQRLALIAQHCNAMSCEDQEQTLTTLARAGQLEALRVAAAWSSLEPAALEAATQAAREAGQPQAAAILMQAQAANGATLGTLDF